MKKQTKKKLFARSVMSEEEYRSADAVNKSRLWQMNKSPLHYMYALENGHQDTQALKMGRAIHEAVLCHEEFPDHWAVSPGVDRRTKEGKQAYESFMAQAEGKGILSPAEFQEIESIRQAVFGNAAAVELLKGCTVEKPLFWTNDDTGISCKCRVDAMKPGIMIDLKTSSDASTKAFLWDALRFGYDVQAAHYIDGYHSISGEFPEWFFIAVEKDPPYAINILKADAGFIDYGYIRRNELLFRLRHCREMGKWPDYGENALCLPEYLEVE